jgi:hypothetical protein
MQHHASTGFWTEYHALPQEVRVRADKQFALMKDKPQHPSLQFKKVGERRGHEFGRLELRLNIELSPSSENVRSCGSGSATMETMSP